MFSGWLMHSPFGPGIAESPAPGRPRRFYISNPSPQCSRAIRRSSPRPISGHGVDDPLWCSFVDVGALQAGVGFNRIAKLPADLRPLGVNPAGPVRLQKDTVHVAPHGDHMVPRIQNLTDRAHRRGSKGKPLRPRDRDGPTAVGTAGPGGDDLLAVRGDLHDLPSPRYGLFSMTTRFSRV